MTAARTPAGASRLRGRGAHWGPRRYVTDLPAGESTGAAPVRRCHVTTTYRATGAAQSQISHHFITVTDTRRIRKSFTTPISAAERYLQTGLATQGQARPKEPFAPFTECRLEARTRRHRRSDSN